MRPLDSYPNPSGAVLETVFPHAGPASYTQVTVGTPPTPATGGDVLSVREAGVKLFDVVIGGVTDSANYRVDAIPVNPSGVNVGQQSTTYRLKWTALRTGSIGGQSQVVNTEAIAATDLSAEIVRLFAKANR